MQAKHGLPVGDLALPGPAGTSALIEAGAITALSGYLSRVRDEGVTWSPVCGCMARRDCGYHADQRRRAQDRDAELASARSQLT